MLKYFAAFALLISLSVFVTSQHEKHSHDAASQSQEASSAILPASDAKQAKSNIENAKWYSPSGNLAYLVFGFPNGITVWALFLTLMVIAEQTRETRNSAKATQASVVLMKRQADAMDDQNKATQNQERARLSISAVDKPEFRIAGAFPAFPNSVPVIVHIFITIDGSSHAYDIDGFGQLRIEPTPNGKHVASGVRLKLPRIIRFTDTTPIKIPVTGLGDIAGVLSGGDVTYIPTKLADDVREGRQHLRITGEIHYKDVFGKSHHTPFDYAWFVPGYDSTWRWIEGCHWMDQSVHST